jgi:probable rRNA maturation factor
MKLEVVVQIAPILASAGEAALNVDRFRAVAEAVLRHEKAPGQMTLVITDDEGIRALNRDFLGLDSPTDVLAFGAQEDAGAFVTSPEMGGYLGDVIVAHSRAVAQAREYGHPVGKELDTLIVHGVLHLLGYDHADDEEKAIMWARQDQILRGL